MCSTNQHLSLGCQQQASHQASHQANQPGAHLSQHRFARPPLHSLHQVQHTHGVAILLPATGKRWTGCPTTFGNAHIGETAPGVRLQNFSRCPQGLVSTWAHSLQRLIVPACSPQQLKVSARGGVQRVEAVQHNLRLEHGRVGALGPVQRDGAAHLQGGGRGWGQRVGAAREGRVNQRAGQVRDLQF